MVVVYEYCEWFLQPHEQFEGFFIVIPTGHVRSLSEFSRSQLPIPMRRDNSRDVAGVRGGQKNRLGITLFFLGSSLFAKRDMKTQRGTNRRPGTLPLSGNHAIQEGVHRPVTRAARKVIA